MVEEKTSSTDRNADGDAKRIAACLAACRGIPTEALESGIILKLIAACVHVKEPRIQEILQLFGAVRTAPASSARHRRET